MASSKTFLLLGLVCVVLILIVSEASARELAETTTQINQRKLINGAYERSAHGGALPIDVVSTIVEGKVPMDMVSTTVKEKVVTDVSETPTVKEGKDKVETMATMKDQDLELLRLKQ
ncbi:hypothetical protein Prudu_000981 [Prunus dulcis]|uniref:Uncharacterized protein n=1 Tax=Prunus dulcis TaxID=3755 RepID=A0A4Y1QMR0_PRUDU|nr:hypothetical protein Prudu_000981 [Prunus dulcis]